MGGNSVEFLSRNLNSIKVPTNSNRKISYKVYIDQILEFHKKERISGRTKFVLEEDGDSGHGNGTVWALLL